MTYFVNLTGRNKELVDDKMINIIFALNNNSAWQDNSITHDDGAAGDYLNEAAVLKRGEVINVILASFEHSTPIRRKPVSVGRSSCAGFCRRRWREPETTCTL